MKIQDIFLDILWEQIVRDPDDEDNNGVHGFDDGEFAGGNNEEPENPEEPVGEPNTPEGQPGVPIQEPQKPKKVKPLTEIEKIKLKWKEENPGLTDENMDDTIEFFNRRKNGLREYKDPATAPGYVNLPEITALLQRFPGMRDALSNHQKIRDIQNYTWEQMEFFMDRAGTTMAAAEMDFSIEGDTPETRWASAMKKWDSPINLIFNENNVIVHKITGKDEAIALGRLQHILVSRYGGNNWCITNAPGMSAANLYSSYRDRRAYYFVLDKNRKEDDPYFLSTIEPVDMSSRQSYEGPYAMTPAPNGTDTGKSWRDVLKIHPQLEGKEGLFRYFGPTPKEKVDISIDRINFREGDPNDFAVQKLNVQRLYVESGRLINDKRAFSVLPYDKMNNLRKDYIARATLEDYKNRFKCDDTRDPFGILNMIQRDTPGLYTFLDEVVLMTQLHLPRGVWGIKAGIVGINYNPVFTDIDNRNITLYREKSGHNYGLLDIDKVNWIKPMGYIMTTPKLLVRRDERGISQFTLQRYSSRDGSDYFYFLLNTREYLNKQSPNYAKGKYLDKRDGDAILQSNEYRQLGYEKK
jgi:hypothetical protein